MAGHSLHVDVLGERLVARVHVEDPLASTPIRRGHEDLAVEATRPQERLVELLEHVRRRHHDHVVAGVETVHLHQ